MFARKFIHHLNSTRLSIRGVRPQRGERAENPSGLQLSCQRTLRLVWKSRYDSRVEEMREGFECTTGNQDTGSGSLPSVYQPSLSLSLPANPYTHSRVNSRRVASHVLSTNLLVSLSER